MGLNGVRENVDNILFLIVKLDEKLTSLASPHTDGAVSSTS